MDSSSFLLLLLISWQWLEQWFKLDTQPIPYQHSGMILLVSSPIIGLMKAFFNLRNTFSHSHNWFHNKVSITKPILSSSISLDQKGVLRFFKWQFCPKFSSSFNTVSVGNSLQKKTVLTRARKTVDYFLRTVYSSQHMRKKIKDTIPPEPPNIRSISFDSEVSPFVDSRRFETALSSPEIVQIRIVCKRIIEDAGWRWIDVYSKSNKPSQCT